MSVSDRWGDREVVDVDWNLERDDLTLTATIKARITVEELEDAFASGLEESLEGTSPYESLNGSRHPKSAYGFVLQVLAEIVTSEIDVLRR